MKRKLGWGVLTLWIVFWIYCGFAAGILDGGGLAALGRMLVFIAVFGTGALVAWHSPSKSSPIGCRSPCQR